MKALRYTSKGLFLDTQAAQPVPRQGEARIRVLLAGICRTDLELTKGYMGFEGILGHEFVGIVDSPGLSWPIGARVVGEINAACGHCSLCRQRLERHCRSRTVLGIYGRDGCMAEWLTLPVENLLAIPDVVSNEAAVFVEPLAAALEIFEQIHIEPTHRICILGDGKLGLITALAMGARHGRDILLIGHHQTKLDLVKDFAVGILENDLSPELQKQWDIVIEATGASQGLQQAMTLVRPRGTIVLKSTMAHAEALDLTPLVIDEVAVVGSRCGRFAPAIRLLAENRIPVERLIEAVYPLHRAEEAWERANAPGAKKVLLDINAE
ncbi:MAG: alcohol dehydrogenase [Candidatus Omnitrophota bacterium]|nr:MAG: alcohol dehydrogenase [Candidatus Omnitrophota bacterium]